MANKKNHDGAVDDWPSYEAARLRNNEIHGEYLRTFSDRAYEYGILTVKNLTLISGGAIIAIPAIAGLAKNITPEVAAASGIWFVVALLLSVACTYFIHLNWQANYDQRDVQKDRDHAHIIRNFLPSRAHEYDSDEIYFQRSKKFFRVIWWTWVLPHVLGVLGYLVFLFGCWKLLTGISGAVQ